MCTGKKLLINFQLKPISMEPGISIYNSPGITGRMNGSVMLAEIIDSVCKHWDVFVRNNQMNFRSNY